MQKKLMNLVALAWLSVGPVFAQPVNDFFDNRTALSGAPILVVGTNLGATREPGDPTTVGELICNTTVWYRWVAPRSGTFAAVILTPEPVRAGLGVYTGSTSTGLVHVGNWPVREHYPVLHHGVSSLAFQTQFEAVGGREYQFIAGTEAPAEGIFELSISEPPTVSLTRPLAGADFPIGSDVLLRANVSTPAGTIAAVDFNTVFGPQLARISAAPWEMIWAAPEGRHQLQARVINSYGASALATVEFTVGRPPNDNFASRIALQGLPAVTMGRVLASGLEPQESDVIGYYVAHRTVWWRWTSPIAGPVVIMATATNPVIIGVYTGTQLGALTLQGFTAGTHAAVIDGQYKYCSQVVVTASPSQTYQIVIDGSSIGADTVGLTITRPPNVQLTQPTQGSVFPWGTQIDFTVETSDPDGTIQEVRYLEIHTIPNAGWSIPIGTATQPPWSVQSSALSRGSYPIMARVLDNLGALSVSTNRVWIGVPRPPNDDFAQRIILDNKSPEISVRGTNEWASAEFGEEFGRQSIWWSWTAPISGTASIETCGVALGFVPDLRVYTGNVFTVSGLSLIGLTSGGVCSPFSIQATGGATYHIAIDSYQTTGPVTLSIRQSWPHVQLMPSFQPATRTFRISWDPVQGQRSIIEASNDLLSWTALTTNTSPTVPSTFEISADTSILHRFFRVRLD